MAIRDIFVAGIVDFPGVIIPRDTVDLAIRLCKAKGAPEKASLVTNGTRCQFIVGAVSLTSKLVEATFPDYQRVIPGWLDRSGLVDRKAFVAAVKAVSAMAVRGRAIRLTWRDGTLNLSIQDPETGHADLDLPAEWNPETDCGEFEVGANGSYLLAIAEAFDGETLRFEFSGPGNPMLVTDPLRSDFRAVLMPMRI